LIIHRSYLNGLVVSDFDGTLSKKHATNIAGIKLVNSLKDHGLFGEVEYREFLSVQKNYQDNKITYENFICYLSQLHARGLRGISRRDVEDVAIEVAETIILRDGVTDMIEWFINHGFTLILISASPIEIISILASKLRFDKAYGLEAEIENGKYTGYCKNPVTADYRRNIILNTLQTGLYNFPIGIGDDEYEMKAYSDLTLRFLVADDCHAAYNNITYGNIIVKDLKQIIKYLALRLN
jgi:HAD superfamily phosphoserine phosphatase-like hydrolase